MGFGGSGDLRANKRPCSGLNELHEPQGIVFHPVVIEEHIGGFFLNQFLQSLQIPVGIPIGIPGDSVQAEVVS